MAGLREKSVFGFDYAEDIRLLREVVQEQGRQIESLSRSFVSAKNAQAVDIAAIRGELIGLKATKAKKGKALRIS